MKIPEWHALIIVLDHPGLLPLKVENASGIWILLLDVLYDPSCMLFGGVFPRKDSFDFVHFGLRVPPPLGFECRSC
jgi:hypothetical protein